MSNGKRYIQEYKEMITDLYKSGMSLAELSSEYGIAKSTIAGWVKDTKEIKIDENEVLKKSIVKKYKESNGIYGAPKIHKELVKDGVKASLKRVQRKMKELGFVARTVKKYKPHSNKNVKENLENVLNQDFTTTTINEKWVGDITYIHTLKDGWCYLASVLDLYSKKVIGHAFGRKMTTDLVVKALENAYYTQNPDKNNKIIFHSDLGSQYTSLEMKSKCEEFNILQSFSKKGCPYDNACIESFHASFKKEEIYLNKYITFDDARISIFRYIEGWYN